VPFYLAGYSNGGALAVRYAISSVEEKEAMPKVDGLVLFSPEIGIAKTAALAIWQERIGRLLNLKKLRWTGLMVEYDPFKYNSFPVNGGILAHDLTRINRSEIARLANTGKLDDFPPTLAFQSAVDATVSAPDLVRDFFFHLPSSKHELVIYDLNRIAGVEPLLKVDPKENFVPIVESQARKFTITVLKNTDETLETVDALTWLPGGEKSSTYSTGLQWPRDVYSLSHVALPFPGNDPLYGGLNPKESPGVHIGSLALRGEKGTLKVSARDMLRLRWNPFYDYQEERILDHLGLDSP
jgi:alpha-beta hydrolase superfamily lysophospholipase